MTTDGPRKSRSVKTINIILLIQARTCSKIKNELLDFVKLLDRCTCLVGCNCLRLRVTRYQRLCRIRSLYYSDTSEYSVTCHSPRVYGIHILIGCNCLIGCSGSVGRNRLIGCNAYGRVVGATTEVSFSLPSTIYQVQLP